MTHDYNYFKIHNLCVRQSSSESTCRHSVSQSFSRRLLQRRCSCGASIRLRLKWRMSRRTRCFIKMGKSSSRMLRRRGSDVCLVVIVNIPDSSHTHTHMSRGAIVLSLGSAFGYSADKQLIRTCAAQAYGSTEHEDDTVTSATCVHERVCVTSIFINLFALCLSVVSLALGTFFSLRDDC